MNKPMKPTKMWAVVWKSDGMIERVEHGLGDARIRLSQYSQPIEMQIIPVLVIPLKPEKKVKP